MLNAFRLSGDTDMSIMMAAFQVEDIDRIVNIHLRCNPAVLKVKVDLITDIMNDLILAFDFNSELVWKKLCTSKRCVSSESAVSVDFLAVE